MCRGHEGDDMRIPALLSALPVTLALGQGAQANVALTGGAHPERSLIRSEVQNKVRALRAYLLRKRVGLDEVTALQVERVLNETNVPRRELRKKLHATMRQLRQLLKDDSNDDAAYTQALDQLRALRTQMRALRAKEFTELRKVLAPKQQAKLALEMRHFRKSIRKIFREEIGKMGWHKPDHP